MIGGNFALDTDALFHKKPQLSIDERSVFWLQSGRSAFSLLIKLLNFTEKNQVLLPAYHCEEIAKPFLLRGIKVKFYQINKNLQFNLKAIKSEISSKTKLIVYINYLGWPQKKAVSLQAWCKRKRIHLLEDNVPIAPEVLNFKKDTFQIYSFRKLIGIPSGSLLVLPQDKKKTDFLKINLQPTKKTVDWLKITALSLKLIYQWLPWTGFRLISYKIHRLAEDLLDDIPRNISPLAKSMILHANWRNIANKRRKNAKYLLNELKPIKRVSPIIAEILTTAVPLFLPITTTKANDLKQFLLNQGIFTQVDWKWPKYLEKNNFPEVWWLNQNTVYLTVDQRYGKKEIDYQANKIKEFFVNYD